MQVAERAKKCNCLSLVTLTFKLVPAMDKTRLPCEFGVPEIFHRQKTNGAKNRTFCSSLHTVTTATDTLAATLRWFTARGAIRIAL